MLCWCCLYEVVLGSVAALSISVLPATHAWCWVASNESQPSPTAVLITILQLNLCYQLPLGFIPRCFFQKTALLGISDAGFCGPDVLPVSNQQCQSTEGNSKHWCQPGNWPHPFFVYHQIPEGREFCSLYTGSPLVPDIYNHRLKPYLLIVLILEIKIIFIGCFTDKFAVRHLMTGFFRDCRHFDLNSVAICFADFANLEELRIASTGGWYDDTLLG